MKATNPKIQNREGKKRDKMNFSRLNPECNKRTEIK